MKTTKICKGLYQIVHNGRTYQIEDNQAENHTRLPGWMVYEINSHDIREYINDYATKQQAIASLV